MAELLNIQTGSGRFIVTETTLQLERPSFPSVKIETIQRSAITSTECRITMRPSFGRFGGTMRFLFRTNDGRLLELKSVAYKKAIQLCTVLGIAVPR